MIYQKILLHASPTNLLAVASEPKAVQCRTMQRHSPIKITYSFVCSKRTDKSIYFSVTKNVGAPSHSSFAFYHCQLVSWLRYYISVASSGMGHWGMCPLEFANLTDLTPDGFHFWMTLSPRTSEPVRHAPVPPGAKFWRRHCYIYIGL